ncbi:MAG: ATP-binding protein [Fibrobacterota bacterium]
MKSLRYRLLLPFSLILIAILILITVVSAAGFKRFYINSIQNSLSRQLYLSAKNFPVHSVPDTGYNHAIQDHCVFLDKYLECRVTFIDKSGLVKADSRLKFSVLPNIENHSGRPEIVMLKNKSLGISQRYSETVKREMLYLAAGIISGDSKKGYLRFAVSLERIENYLISVYVIMAVSGMAFFIILLFIGYKMELRTENIIEELNENSSHIETGNFPKRKYEGFSPETDKLYNSIDKTSLRIQKLIDGIMREKEEIKALLLSVSESIIAADSELNILFSNENAIRLFNVQHKKITGMPLIGFTHNPDIQKIAEKTIKEGIKKEKNLTIHSGIKSFHIKTVCAPIYLSKNRDEKPAGILLTLVDLTEEKNLARAKTHFVEAASHELKTPITIIKGYLETLEDCNDKKTIKTGLGKMGRNIKRLENLVNDLLQLGYLESGKINFSFEKCSIKEIIEEIALELNTMISEKEVGVNVECFEPQIETVPDLLYIVLFNLITNALKYNKQGGSIRIECHREKERNILKVLDSGIGIPREHRETIFQRFYRVDKHRSRESGGTGLGLAIVKHIVQILDGRIAVIDGIKGGTGFVVSLPSNPTSENQ